MKASRIVYAGLGTVLALSVAACSGQSGASENATDTGAAQPEAQQQAPAAKQKDFDGSGQSEVGEGTVILATSAGTSEDGNVPKITVSKDTILTQIEVDTEGLEGSAVTYIYVDGMEAEKGNFGQAQVSISLTEDTIAAGDHTVEVVQFEGDDPAGTVTFYRSMTFTIAN